MGFNYILSLGRYMLFTLATLQTRDVNTDHVRVM